MPLRTFASTNEPPVGVRRSTTYLAEIESLRGIAMLLVYVFHLHTKVAGQPTPVEVAEMSPWWGYVRAGHTGVSLFFVLSGFLLSLPFFAALERGTPFNVGRFYMRRVLRILPLYYFAVVVGTVLTAHTLADLLRGAPYLFFLNAWPHVAVPMYPYSSTWWSLATEAQYYLVLPLLFGLVRFPFGRWCAALLLVLYVATYATFILGKWPVYTIQMSMALKLSLFGRFPLFACGIVVAWIYHRHAAGIRERLQRSAWFARGGSDVALLATVFALGWLLRWTLWQGYAQAEALPNFAWHMPEGVAWAIVMALVLLAPLRLKRLVVNPILGYLGILSYSIYLWHTALQSSIPAWFWHFGWRWAPGWNLRTTVIALLITVASVVISQITYSAIEKPFLARKARID